MAKAKFDNITLGNWQIFRKNLTDAVMPYYTRVATAFSDTSKGVGKVVGEQQARVSDMLGLLARMEGKGHTPITKKELKRLDKLNTEFRQTHGQVVAWVKDSISLRKGSDSAIKDLAISPKEMKNAEKISKVSTSRRGGLRGLGGLPHMLGLPGVATIGLAGLGGALSSMAGPLTGPGAVALGGMYAGYKGIRSLAGIPGRHRASQMASAGPSAAAALPGIAGAGVAEGMAGTYPRDARGRFAPRGALTGIDHIEKGLFKFFNKRALKARWTRRLLRATEKGSKKGKGGLGGVLSGFGKLGALLPGLLLSLGPVVGLAAAAAFTGIQLHKAGSAALELWETHKAVSEHQKKMLKKEIGFLNEITAGLAEKMQASQKAGDEPARKAAVRELFSVEKEKAGVGEKLKGKERGFFGRLAHDWNVGRKGITSDVEKATGIKKFADGGVVTKPTIGLLGEGYKPEVITPLSEGSVLDVLKAIMKNTAQGAETLTPAPINTFQPPFDLADPLLNQINTTGSLLSLGY